MFCKSWVLKSSSALFFVTMFKTETTEAFPIGPKRLEIFLESFPKISISPTPVAISYVPLV